MKPVPTIRFAGNLILEFSCPQYSLLTNNPFSSVEGFNEVGDLCLIHVPQARELGPSTFFFEHEDTGGTNSLLNGAMTAILGDIQQAQPEKLFLIL